MSSAKSIIINCGATQVGVSVFSNESGRLTLERLVIAELDYDYAGEDAWLGALSVALGGVVRGLKISGPASVIVPGYQLLTKNLKVPQVEKARQTQIIGFEAQNQIPYPLSEVVWDSQIIATDGVEAEVMLFALKQDVANRIAGVISSAGLTPTVLEASTILDYQAWRAANPGDTEETLIINIGARTTNMTFVNASGFSVHNVNVGGNLLTQNISDALAHPFRTAEKLKVEYFSGHSGIPDDDQHAVVLRKCAQEFMRRISQEVTKRIVIYRRQNQNSQPKKIVLTGRGSLLPGLSELLCETQRISVDYLDPFGAFSAGASVDAGYLESCRVRISETVGEAVRATLPGAVGVNLIPASLESEIAFNRIKPLLVGTAALLAVAPWPVWAHFNGAASSAKDQASRVEARARELSGYKGELERVGAESTAIASRAGELDSASDARDNWREFLSDLQSRVSELKEKDVWIGSMKFNRTAPKKGEDGAVLEPEKASVTLEFCMLMKNVAPGGNFNAGAFQSRRREILQALRACPFVADIPAGKEKSDFTKANLPRLTLTLVIKQAQKPL